MLTITKPHFPPTARLRNAANQRGYSTYSTTYGFNGVSHRWGGRECTDQFIQSGPPRTCYFFYGIQLPRHDI